MICVETYCYYCVRFCVFPLFAHADDDGMSAKDIKTLFFGHDDRKAVSDPASSPRDAIGQLETASGNLCTATLISPHLAPHRRSLFAAAAERKAGQGRCVAFLSRVRGSWVYEIHGIDGRTDPSLGKRLKADGDGWIVPSSAAPGTLA